MTPHEARHQAETFALEEIWRDLNRVGRHIENVAGGSHSATRRSRLDRASHALVEVQMWLGKAISTPCRPKPIPSAYRKVKGVE